MVFMATVVKTHGNKSWWKGYTMQDWWKIYISNNLAAKVKVMNNQDLWKFENHKALSAFVGQLKGYPVSGLYPTESYSCQ